MKRIINFLPLLMGALIVLSGFTTAQDNAAQILEASKAKFESLEDFSAEFKYEISNPAMRPVARMGSLKYKQGMFVIALPDQQIYSDGQSQWIFLPQDKEVSVMDYQGDDGLNIDAIFEIYQASATSKYEGTDRVHGNSCHKILLTISDKDLEYNQAYVWINRETQLLEKVVLIDRRQTRTTYEFSSIEENIGMSRADFRFDPSKYSDIDVYDERSQ